jgi:hypothetical protein
VRQQFRAAALAQTPLELIQINAGYWRARMMQTAGKAKEDFMAFRSMLGSALAFVQRLFVNRGEITSTGNGGPECKCSEVPAHCNDMSLLFEEIASIGNSGPGGERWESNGHYYDTSPLFRRMTLLCIDADELASQEPLLTRDLQAQCALCGSKEICVEDLTHEERTGEPKLWREYCPNAAMLRGIAAIQNCPHAAEYLKMPYAWS